MNTILNVVKRRLAPNIEYNENNDTYTSDGKVYIKISTGAYDTNKNYIIVENNGKPLFAGKYKYQENKQPMIYYYFDSYTGTIDAYKDSAFSKASIYEEYIELPITKVEEEDAYMRDGKKYVKIDKNTHNFNLNKSYIIVEQRKEPIFAGNFIKKDGSVNYFVLYTGYITSFDNESSTDFNNADKYEEQTHQKQNLNNNVKFGHVLLGGKRNKTNKKRRNQKTKKSGRRRPFRK